jgi:hypothetical protein
MNTLSVVPCAGDEMLGNHGTPLTNTPFMKQIDYSMRQADPLAAAFC